MSTRNLVITLTLMAVVGAVGFQATPTAALTASEIQVQIQTLLERIAELTKQLNVLQGQNASLPETASPTAVKHSICAILARDLRQGSQGDDVVSLQEFLRSEGHLSASATGYFGPMTREALARWQASQGISAVGILGPLSRERIKIWCGGSWTNQERFNATPTRGEAPLTVTFSTWLSGFRPTSMYYTIDFGDGESERAADCPAPADACTGPGQNKHMYEENGTYTATLNKVTDPCPDDGDPNTPRCLAPIQSEAVGKVQIYVGSQACTKEYKPVCGHKQVQCITVPCNPVQQTYGNRCMLNADGATFLYEGVCKETGTDPSKDLKCKAWYDGCNNCSRETADSPAMCTLRACAWQAPAYCTAYFEEKKEPTYCTMDAMQCPDGSWVGRTGANCQFVCPD